MNANLEGAIVGERVYLQGSWNELPRNLATNVVLDGIDKRLTATCQASLVVIKLQILRNQ